MPNVTHLECSLCASRFEPHQIHNLCSCGGTLYVRYDLPAIKATWTRDSVRSARTDLWRYLPVLPPQREESIVSLGEGMTPLIRTSRLGAAIGVRELVGEGRGAESHGVLQGARPLMAAITMAHELGLPGRSRSPPRAMPPCAAAVRRRRAHAARIFMPATSPRQSSSA